MSRAGARTAAGRGPPVTTQAAVPGKAAPRAPSSPSYARLEHQAETAAQAFLAGARGLASGLSPTPAAGFRLGTSPGEALPPALRAELERAFGADLGAVRIHRGDAAHVAAEAEGAAAFTAGRDIYFGSGRFHPTTQSGRRLLAHEVAHVLQQTARAGNWSAADRSATGDIQRDDLGGTGPGAKLPPDAGKRVLVELAQVHRRGTSGRDESLEDVIAFVESATGGDLGVATATEGNRKLIPLAEKGRLPDASKRFSAAAAGYLLDCLKVCGTAAHYDAAYHILDRDSRFQVRVVLRPQAFVDHLRKKLGKKFADWRSAAFEEPSLAAFIPEAYEASLRRFLISPWDKVGPLPGLEAARGKVQAILQPSASPALGPNERVLLGWTLLDDVEAHRRKALEVIQKDLEQAGSRANQGIRAAMQLSGIMHHEERDPEQPDFFRKLTGSVAALADEAHKFWIQAAETAKTQLEKSDTLTPPPELLTALAGEDGPLFERLHQVLARAAAPAGILGQVSIPGEEGPEMVPPEPRDYAKRAEAVQAELGFEKRRGVFQDLQSLALELFRKGELLAARGKAVGWAVGWVTLLEKHLAVYDPKKDTDGFLDERLYHRAMLATDFGTIGRAARWSDLVDAQRIVMQAEVENRSRIAIHGEWRPESVPMHAMLDDFGDRRDTEIEGLHLTAREVTTFFQAAYLNEVARIVEADAVRAETTQKTATKAESERLRKDLEAIKKPRRFRPDDFAILRRKQDTDLRISSLMLQNPKTTAALGAVAKAESLGPLFAMAFPPAKVVAWLIPDVTPLVDTLREVPFLRDKVAAKAPGETDPVKWLQTLRTVTTTEDLLAPLRVDLSRAKERAGKMLRRRTTALRRILTADATKLLETYADDRTVKNFVIPGNVVDAITRFYRYVEPEADMEPQVAALVLAIAPALRKAFPEVQWAMRLPPAIWIFLEFGLKYAKIPPATPDPKDPAPVVSLREVVEIHGDPAKDDSLDKLRANAADLMAVKEVLDAARAQFQQRFGFQSEDGRTIKSLVYYPELEPGLESVFEIQGAEWILQRVHRKFTYHPALRAGSGVGKSAKPILKNEKGKPIPITDEEVLLTFIRNGEPYEVKATDTEVLAELSRMVEERAFSIQMGNLGEIVEGAAMLVVDIVELIPGVGQEVMVARLAAQTTVFLAEELPVIVQQIKNDPIEFITGKLAELKSKLSIGNVIEFVLTGGQKNPLDSIRFSAAKSGRPTRPGKLGRIIRALRRLGGRLADAVKRLQLRFRPPFRRLQAEVLTRPRLTWLLRKGLDVVHGLAELIPGETDPVKAVLGESALDGDLKASVTEAGNDFKERLETFLTTLQELELPQKIIPLEEAIEWIIDFVLSRMGAKVRIARRVLQYTDVFKDLAKKIHDSVISGTEADPNVHWRRSIVPLAEQRVRDTRNDVVDRIYGFTDKLADLTGIAEFRLARPGHVGEGDFHLTQTPEVEMSASVSRLPATRDLLNLPLTPGAPLAAVVRNRAERAFGHDFGHVRLHTGPEAERPLGLLGARGLTSGSHVYLRPDVSPDSPLGQHVLRHELTHVLQQSGPRPLSRTHDERPRRGRPGIGVRLDAGREAAAELMAKAATGLREEPASAGEPVDGMQPDFDPTTAVAGLLDRLTQLKGAEEFEGRKGKKAVPGEAQAQQAWKAVVARLRKNEKNDFAPYLGKDAVRSAVVQQVLSAGINDQEVAQVAALAQDPVKPKPGQPITTTFNLGHFAAFLEVVVFQKTGVILSIQLKGTDSVSLKDLKVVYLHLGLVDPGPIGKSPLWDEVMKNSPAIAVGDDPKKVRYEVHARLAAMGPDPMIWPLTGSELQFSTGFIEVFKKRIRSSVAVSTMEKVPTVKEYLETGPTDGVGLRIGKHHNQKGTDRESHHTTQYLLVQFFRNHNTVKAWKPRKDYPGIKPGPTNTTHIATSGAPLELHKLDTVESIRGAGMPAILLASDSHRRGQLHIGREAHWEQRDGDPGVIRQGHAINNRFHRALKDQFSYTDDDPDWNTKVQADPKAADKIAAAMTRTYHWMRGEMLPSLERCLVSRELAYYRGLAARTHRQNHTTGTLATAYNLTDDHLRTIFAAAKKNNDDLMSSAGWKTP